MIHQDDQLDAQIRGQIAEMKAKLRDYDVALLQDSAMRDLNYQPAWQQFLASMAGVAKDTLESIAAAEMSPYQLGFRQGYLRAVRLVAKAVPMADEQLADTRRERDRLAEHIEQFARLARSENDQ